MTADEFPQWMLRYEGSDTPRHSLVCAADFFVQKGYHNESAVGPCLELARHIAKFYGSAEPTPRQAQPLHILPSPGELIASDLLVQKIGPYVARLRQALFSSQGPPFASYQAAVEWLIRTGREERDRWQAESPPPPPWLQGTNAEFAKWETWPEDNGQPDQRGEIHVWRDEAHQRRFEAELLAEPWWHPSFIRRAIPYKPSGDLSPEFIQHWESIPIFDADSPLGRLEWGAHEIAEMTGFSKLSVVAFILAEVQPVRQAVTLDFQTIRTVVRGAGPPAVQRPSENEVAYQRAIVEIYAPENITADDFGMLYRWLRQAGKVSRRHRFTARDRLLLDVVKRLGGVPAKGIMPFWERVAQMCNRESGGKQFKNRDHARITYGKLKKRLDDSLPVERLGDWPPAEKRRVRKPRPRR
jgi:hypothetical protein